MKRRRDYPEKLGKPASKYVSFGSSPHLTSLVKSLLCGSMAMSLIRLCYAFIEIIRVNKVTVILQIFGKKQKNKRTDLWTHFFLI